MYIDGVGHGGSGKGVDVCYEKAEGYIDKYKIFIDKEVGGYQPSHHLNSKAYI